VFAEIYKTQTIENYLRRSIRYISTDAWLSEITNNKRL
jgi:hypothetical protein